MLASTRRRTPAATASFRATTNSSARPAPKRSHPRIHALESRQPAASTDAPTQEWESSARDESIRSHGPHRSARRAQCGLQPSHGGRRNNARARPDRWSRRCDPEGDRTAHRDWRTSTPRGAGARGNGRKRTSAATGSLAAHLDQRRDRRTPRATRHPRLGPGRGPAANSFSTRISTGRPLPSGTSRAPRAGRSEWSTG